MSDARSSNPRTCGHLRVYHYTMAGPYEERQGACLFCQVERLQRELTESLDGCERWAERNRQLVSERDRLRDFVNGLLGLVQLIDMRDDLPREIGEAMSNNHRYLDALHYMNGLPPPRYADETPS